MTNGIDIDDDIAEVTGSDRDFKKALVAGAFDKMSQLTIGGKITVIPDELGRLTNLEHLYVEKCKVKALPETFFELVSLQTFSANTVRMARLPEGGWGSLDQLTTLVLPGGLTELPADLGDAKNIAGELDLRHTKIKALPESVGRMAHVNAILCPPGLETLPTSIGGMKSLASLTLGKVRALPEDLGSLKELKEIWVAEGAPLKVLPESIGKCSALSDLELRGLRLSALPESLADCPLEHLSLTKMDRLTTLPARLGANGTLQTLALGTGVTSLPTSLLKSRELRRVILPSDFESQLRASSEHVLATLGKAVAFQ